MAATEITIMKRSFRAQYAAMDRLLFLVGGALLGVASFPLLGSAAAGTGWIHPVLLLLGLVTGASSGWSP